MARRFSTEREASSTKVRGTVAMILQEEQEASRPARSEASCFRGAGEVGAVLPDRGKIGRWKPVVGLVAVETGGGSGGSVAAGGQVVGPVDGRWTAVAGVAAVAAGRR